MKIRNLEDLNFITEKAKLYFMNNRARIHKFETDKELAIIEDACYQFTAGWSDHLLKNEPDITFQNIALRALDNGNYP